MAAIVEKSGGAGKGKGGADLKKPRFGRVKANLQMGILGLPNVGKSSFFNLLTDQEAEAAKAEAAVRSVRSARNAGRDCWFRNTVSVSFASTTACFQF